MLRRYELTDDEWNRIVIYFLLRILVNRTAHEKITVPLSTEWCGSLAVVLHGATCQSVMAHGRLFTAASANE